MNNYELISAYNKEMESDKWKVEIPYISFSKNWSVKIIPPTLGAVVRFLVKDKSKGEKEISIYLDCYNNLGYVGAPYWEIYPDYEETNSRFYIGEIDKMLMSIKESLDVQ
tara:strand:- start:6897 stop:7226 length:330 start_codon:yes stop_codon:yes gene_type:complete